MRGEAYNGVEWHASMHALQYEIRFRVHISEHDKELYQPIASEKHSNIDRAGDETVTRHTEVRGVQEVRGHLTG